MLYIYSKHSCQNWTGYQTGPVKSDRVHSKQNLFLSKIRVPIEEKFQKL